MATAALIRDRAEHLDVVIGGGATAVTLVPTLATPAALLAGEKGARAAFAPEPVPADFAVRGGGALPGAALTLIDGGHMIPVTRPDETAAWIRSQVRRTPSEK